MLRKNKVFLVHASINYSFCERGCWHIWAGWHKLKICLAMCSYSWHGSAWFGLCHPMLTSTTLFGCLYLRPGFVSVQLNKRLWCCRWLVGKNTNEILRSLLVYKMWGTLKTIFVARFVLDIRCSKFLKSFQSSACWFACSCRFSFHVFEFIVHLIIDLLYGSFVSGSFCQLLVQSKFWLVWCHAKASLYHVYLWRGLTIIIRSLQLPTNNW